MGVVRMTDLTSFPRHSEKIQEIVTAWQIPEPRATDEQEAEVIDVTETTTEARLVDLLGW
jgi:hypothetical protein